MNSAGVRGMTLLEILVSLAILAAVAGLSLPAVRKARLRGLTVRTQGVIAAVEAAVVMYESDCGDYPTGDGEGSMGLVGALRGPASGSFWKGPYARFRESEIGPDGSVLDAWHNPVSYAYPQAEHANIPFTLVSPGPDGKLHTDDDIGNW